MTHEMVPADETPARRAPLMAGGRPMAIVPQSMEDCYRLAVAVCKAKMAPPGMDTPEQAMVAVMHGLEVGLTPMAALQRIAVVNGRPTIWGDGAMSLVRASGVCEYVNEEIEGTGDARVAVCEAKRRGEPKPIRRTFSVADAKVAGLWDTRETVRRRNRQTNEWYEAKNDAPWHRYPERMLAMRARAFCLRDGFADVLGGLYLKEEMDNDGAAGSPSPEPQRRVAPSASAPVIEHKPEPELRRELDQQMYGERQPAPQATEKPAERRRAPSASQQPAPQALQSAPAGYDPEKVRSAFEDEASAATNREQLNDAWEKHVGPLWDTDALPTGHPDRDELDALYRQHAARVDGKEGEMP